MLPYFFSFDPATQGIKLSWLMLERLIKIFCVHFFLSFFFFYHFLISSKKNIFASSSDHFFHSIVCYYRWSDKHMTCSVLVFIKLLCLSNHGKCLDIHITLWSKCINERENYIIIILSSCNMSIFLPFH